MTGKDEAERWLRKNDPEYAKTKETWKRKRDEGIGDQLESLEVERGPVTARRRGGKRRGRAVVVEPRHCALAECGKLFEPKFASHVYHEEKCAKRAKRRRERPEEFERRRRCEVCERRFWPSRLSQRYCTRAHKELAAARRRRAESPVSPSRGSK